MQKDVQVLNSTEIRQENCLAEFLSAKNLKKACQRLFLQPENTGKIKIAAHIQV